LLNFSLYVFHYTLSIVNYPLSIVNSQLSILNYYQLFNFDVLTMLMSSLTNSTLKVYI